MMGQQTVAGGALRRMILALTVAALMVATMVATAAPAFANQGYHRADGSVENEYNSSSAKGYYDGGAWHGGDYENDYNGGKRKGDWRN